MQNLLLRLLLERARWRVDRVDCLRNVRYFDSCNESNLCKQSSEPTTVLYDLTSVSIDLISLASLDSEIVDTQRS